MEKESSRERAERDKEKIAVKERLKDKKRRAYLPKIDEEQKTFIEYCTWWKKNGGGSILKALREGLENGTYTKPSEFFEKECGWLFGDIIYESQKSSFLYEVDNCIKYQYQLGSCRRSFRVKEHYRNIENIISITARYIDCLTDRSLEEICSGNLNEDELIYRKYYYPLPSCHLAYLIDSGDEYAINWVRDTLSAGNSASFSPYFIRAVMMTENTELIELAGKLLVAARLQEGARQVICENCDGGTYTAFRIILRYIRENDLIRFSSVKRAVGTWCGLIAGNSGDLARISGKTMDIICDLLDSTELRDEYLKSEDSMKIWLAMWAYACEDAGFALTKLDEMEKSGSRHQLLTAVLFSTMMPSAFFRVKPAKRFIIEHSSDVEIAALCLHMIFDVIQMYVYEGAAYEMFYQDKPYDPGQYMSQTFDSKEEALEIYTALASVLKSMPEKEMTFSKCVFSWVNESISRSELAAYMSLIAAWAGDEALVESTAGYLSEIGSSGPCYNNRSFYQALLVNRLSGEKQLDMLVNMFCDSGKGTREYAYIQLKKRELKPEHYRKIEDQLRLKADDIRLNSIEIIMRLKDDDLMNVIERLLSDKNETKRTAGMDILLRLSKDENRQEEYRRFQPLAGLVKKPSEKEKILLGQLKETEDKAKEENPVFFRGDETFTPTFDMEYINECNEVFKRYFPASGAFGGKGELPDIKAILDKLDRLIDEHKNDEYTNIRGEQELLGNSGRIYTDKQDEKGRSIIAFPELWDEFYKKEMGSPEVLETVYMAGTWYNSNFSAFKKYAFGFVPFQKSEITLAYTQQINCVLSSLRAKYITFEEIQKIDFAVNYMISQYTCEEDLYEIRSKRPGYMMESMSDEEKKNHQELYSVLTDSIFGTVYSDHFASAFSLKRILTEKFRKIETEKFTDIHFYCNDSALRYESEVRYVRAAYEGLISEGFMYRHFFEELESMKDLFDFLSSIAAAYYERERKLMDHKRWHAGSSIRWYLRELTGENDDDINEKNLPVVEYTAGIYEKLIKLVLDRELKRGDSLTEYSSCIRGINRIYGIDYYVQILCALGDDKLERNRYGYGDSPSKNESLSHLLGVCVPAPGDNAEKLKKALEGKGISEKRLVEAALFSPEWIDITGELLGWKGFRTTCFYFIAQTVGYMDERLEAVVSRYTPVDRFDIARGVFALDWFKIAYEETDEKHFKVIYDAAKYISEGSRHTRARKYADAALGKLDADKAEEIIHKKRDKDMLSAYMLMPLKNDDDAADRYLHIQRFRKESKAFGSQRRESEAQAADIAMKNLAVAMGFDDVTRLDLIMEKSVFDRIKKLTEPKTIEDITVRLAVDEFGKTDIEILKGDKKQKSIPAKLKKDEYILKLKETKKQLTEQYSRTKAMFERSMEDRTVFGAGELMLLLDNPVTFPVAGRLVYCFGESTGFLTKEGLKDTKGNITVLKPKDELIIAHPYDLYKSGVWHDYQHYVFENGIVQPFKQVFRELYTKTDEERGKYNTIRYAGNQIQPKQTIACLKSRRWTIDREDGLQRVFYKENIIAKIYAMADWFSPADIEYPTLEWVCFYDRLTYKSLKIDEIPDVIFSEVMRDVDLVVSVAHAGNVDPESSHSTVEMRRAICEFTAKMFKLDNVRFEKSHAFIEGKRADYAIHLGSGVVHIQGGPMINILPVHSQHRGRLFLPFVDDDPKTSQIVTEILLFADDMKIKDPYIISQING